jgi:phospholipid-binding lipoprotein MlaA
MLWPARLAAACLLCALASGCATPEVPDPSDPWERMNRGTFAFNEAADRWVIEPVAKGWDFVVPEFAQTGVANFFENLRMPAYLVNNLLQLELEQATVEIFRFVLNSTFGLAGFVDVATKADWPHYPEDFGLTMGHWGVPKGPYLVLPIFGASTARDTVGLAADSAMSVYSYFVPIYVPIAARATDLLNKRAIFLEEIAQSREEAFDFYVFVRNAYLQNREHRLLGLPEGTEPDDTPGEPGAATEDEEDLYYFDEFDDEYDDEFETEPETESEAEPEAEPETRESPDDQNPS